MYLRVIYIYIVLIPSAYSFGTWGFLINLLKAKLPNGNTKCDKQLNRVYSEIESGSEWALRMLDATAKLESGILDGNLYHLGSFDECLAVHDSEYDIYGKYCLATLQNVTKNNMFDWLAGKNSNNKKFQLTKNSVVTLNWGVCVPDGCSAEELNRLTGILDVKETACQTIKDAPQISFGDLCVFGFIATIFIFVIIATSLDVYKYVQNQKPAPGNMLSSFSLWINAANLFECTNNASHLLFVNGIRSISLAWILLGHIYTVLNLVPTYNFVDTLNFHASRKTMLVTGANLAVDTFFVLSGMFTTYSYMIKHAKGHQFNLLQFYLRRYLRITIPLAILILLNLSLLKHMGSGPIWDINISTYVSNCQKYWWAGLLHIQNWTNPNEPCVSTSWYLSVDMQLYFMSPLLLLPVVKHPRKILIAVVVLAAASICISFYVAWSNSLGGVLNGHVDGGGDYVAKYYNQPYTRASTWLIGIILGYFTFQAKSSSKEIRMNKVKVLILWSVSLTITTTCVFAGENLLMEYDKMLSTLRIAFVRPLWAVAVSWMIYACAIGYGGPIHKLLSLPIFEIFGKVSFHMYILHYTWFEIIRSNLRKPFRFSHFILYYYFSHFLMIFALSVFWILVFDSPFLQMINYMKKRATKKLAYGTLPSSVKDVN